MFINIVDVHAFAFVVMINDLQAKGLLHKYMDDSTVT